MLAAVATVCVLLFVGCDWTTYRGGAAHTGESPGESTIGLANVGGLELAWTTAGIQNATSYEPPVVALGRLYVRGLAALAAFDASGVTGCGGTPRSCQPVWQTDSPVSSPAVSGSTVYGIRAGSLAAYDATGATGCTGSPLTCQPLWTGVLGTGATVRSPVTVDGGTVYVSAAVAGANVLLAFDAAGELGCAGTPTVCQPLWTATVEPSAPDGTNLKSSPTVASGRVYVAGDDDALHVFDAAGQEGCGGSPRQCGELWTAPVPLTCAPPGWSDGYVCGVSTPAVSGGRVFVNAAGRTGGVYAFDAAGTASCGGVPKICAPLWRTGGGNSTQPPAVANGVVLAVAGQRLRAFDAAGVQGCSGTPTVCAPQWESTNQWFAYTSHFSFGAPAVANGVAYVAGLTDGVAVGPYVAAAPHVYAFDVAGEQGCAGVPKRCAPLLDLAGPISVEGTATDPVVANGVLFVGETHMEGRGLGAVNAYEL